MALKWLVGDFTTGNTSETAVLPVVRKGDNVSLDINSGDSATLTIAKDALPSDWRTYLKPIDKMVVLVDDEVGYASSVTWAGFINKQDGKVKDVVKIQPTGIREWLATRIITNVFNTTNADPTAGVTFTASTWQGVMSAIIQHAFSNSSIPAGAPTNPTVLGTVDGVVSGNTYSYTVKNSDAKSYAAALDEIRDKLSKGNEYKFVPRWSSSAKTKIVWDAIIGSDTSPHIGESTTVTIQLADNTWKPLSYGQSASSDNLVSRIIGQSKYGSGTSGSDFTTKTSTAGTKVLIDQFFNAGVELTSAELDAQLTSRLSYNSTLNNEATFERSYDTLADLRTMISHLGKMATFTGTEQASQFGVTMRIVGLTFSPEKKIITVSLIPKAARYPNLPKDRQTGIGNNGYNNTGGSGSGYNPQTPLTPPAPVTPPFQLPKDNYTDAESILEPIDIRHFAAWNSFGDKRMTKSNLSSYWHRQPDVTRSRINFETGEMIGLQSASRMLYGFDDNTSDPFSEGQFQDRRDSRTVNKATNGTAHNKDIDLWSVDIAGMFDRDSNPYMNMTYNTVPNADNFKKRIGGIGYWQFQDLEIDPVTFKNGIPASTFADTRIMSIADYNMFCTKDLQTIYVQVMVTTSLSQTNTGIPSEGFKSYSSTLSKVFKGVRNANGMVDQFDSLGPALNVSNGTPDQKTFFSTAIYDINGQFHAFGGYLIPYVEDNVKAPTINPAYELKFYKQGHMIVDPTNFVYKVDEITLPGLAMSETGAVNENTELKAKFPYAINVDYTNEKLTLGISRGANGRTSQYFQSSFANLLSFTKIMSTDRETDLMKFTKYNSMIADQFRFRSKAPISYKNNFFLFNGSSTIDPVKITIGAGYTNKKLIHIRGKSGFEDTVSGSLSFLTAGNGSGGTSDKAKDYYNIHNSTANSGNDLGAFGNYWYRQTTYTGETRNVGGMEYFIYKGFLYMICDTTLFEYESTNDNTTGGVGAQPEWRYWIGKFRVRDEIL